MRSAPRYRPPDGFFRQSPDGSLLARVDLRELTPCDDEFPPAVAAMERAPKRLWVAGRDLRSFGSMIAVIGARRATPYGLSFAHRIAGDLAVGGVCVVSGLARGCDAAAHDGALEAGGTTIAVLGSGADVCYPPGSRTLYAEIAVKGAIVSATPPGHVPFKHDFIYRNAIMVAMSAGVLVVQGTRESAAVKTGFAAAETTTVFAVPGSIDSPQSEGVHDLLKSGATCCTRADDIKRKLEGEIQWSAPDVRPIPEHLPAAQQRILSALSGGAAGRERVVARSGLDVVEAVRTITALQIAGYVVEDGALLRRTR